MIWKKQVKTFLVDEDYAKKIASPFFASVGDKAIHVSYESPDCDKPYALGKIGEDETEEHVDSLLKEMIVRLIDKDAVFT